MFLLSLLIIPFVFFALALSLRIILAVFGVILPVAVFSFGLIFKIMGGIFMVLGIIFLFCLVV
ncbi:MAG: hypothetical protein J5505_03005 [Spirochaetaceae bacterium]|nr:hypothetical protein [Spirochaetaceae bacterium]